MDMYDILKKLNSVGSKPLYESAVPRAADVDKSKIPAYKRKDSGEEKLTLKDLEAERSKSATGAAGLKKLKDRTDISESDVEEGNEYVNARKDAIRAGKPTFTVGGKTHKVTGDTSQEKAEVEESAEETPRGRIHRAAPGGYGRKYDQDEEGGEKKPAAPKIDRGRGRPKKERQPFSGDEASKLQSFVVGNKPKSGLPGKAGVKHTKMADQEKAEKARERASAKDEVDEGKDEFDPANRGEYDREGEMARDQLKTAADAANELRSILDSDENLPEWIQSKITMAMDYLDTARDNMKSREDDEEPVEESGNYSAKRARAGADIGKPGKNFAKIEKSAAKKYGSKEAGARVAGAVLNKLRHPKEEVEETTTAGSVATAPAEGGKKTKGGVQFGKGVYEGALAESFSSKLKTMLNEEISMNLTTNSNGTKSLTVTATDDDAMRLAEILKLAGMESQAPAGDTAEACGDCGQSPCGCDHIEEDDHANSPDPMYADTDTMVNKLSGGLNGRKATGQTTIPVVASQIKRQHSMEESASLEQRLWTIYNRQDTK